MHFATAVCNFSTFQQTKVVQTCGVLYILTFKCAFRHSGVQLFDSRTSKSAPKTTVFNILTGKCAFHHSGVQFFDICTSKSSPNTSCFAHFDLNMCFSAPGNFSTVERQKVVRRLQFFNILTFKCAFRHSGMQFFDI